MSSTGLPSSTSPKLLGFANHNHRQCVANALKEADQYCLNYRHRFTHVRRRTLGILLESHSAMGAYELLERLNKEALGSKPPVAYRALSFLIDHGFVHRIEKLNAYIACSHPGLEHDPAFLICKECGVIGETPVMVSAGKLAKTARRSGFEIHAFTQQGRIRANS